MVKNRKMDWINLSTISLIIAILAGIIGMFGGIPGIKTLFFSKPSISIERFLPVAVFDEFNDEKTKFQKFSLNGILKVVNQNSFDIIINEMRVYGRTIYSSGKYKFPGNKPVIYELRLVGLAEEGGGIVKAYSNSFIRFKIIHFENKTGPGEMHTPLISVGDPELGIPIFHIYLPSFNQLFKWNEERVPRELVEEVKNGRLAFSLVFNNELIQITPRNILNLYQCQSKDWNNYEDMVKKYNIENEHSKDK